MSLKQKKDQTDKIQFDPFFVAEIAGEILIFEQPGINKLPPSGLMAMNGNGIFTTMQNVFYLFIKKNWFVTA